MTAQTVAAAYYRRSAALALLAERQVSKQFRRPQQAATLTARFQAASAQLAITLAAVALVEQDAATAGETVQAAGFLAGATDLFDLFTGAPSPGSLGTLAATLVRDSGRSAVGVYAATRTVETGTIRYLIGASCERCTILAGRWYRHSQGFLRHPHCDCVNLPATREASGDLIRNPQDAFDRGLVTGLSDAQTQAIRDGADMAQVVNAQRGMRMTNFAGRRIQTTTEGTTRRGQAFAALSRRGTVRSAEEFVTRQTRAGTALRQVNRVRAAASRLTPESIYAIAGLDRELAIRLLRLNGYIR